jgi:ABC-2 type transport system ATP-binding protein
VAGTVSVLGLEPRADRAALAGRIGVMLQRGGVYPVLGPRRVLDLFAAYYPDPRPTDELLDLVGLRAVAATSWRHLSGGEQQRLSLALALVGRPEVAFLDEPTAGVDPEGRLAVRDVIAGLRDEGVCVVLATHELVEAEKVADRIVVLAGGRIVLEGSPGQLTAGSGKGPGAMVSFGAPAGLDTDELVRAIGGALGTDVVVEEVTPGRYRAEASGEVGTPALTAALAAHLAERGALLTDLVAGRTLEDVYFGAVGRVAGRTGNGTGAAGQPGRGRKRRRAPR